MINRGNHHVLYNRDEMMRLIKNPLTLNVLLQLQDWYEIREQRKLQEKGGCELDGIKQIEKEQFLGLIAITREWLRPSNDQEHTDSPRRKKSPV
jgi:hypothetical protein